MRTYRIGIIGFGKIAQDQHLPVIRADPRFELLAVSSQRGLTVADASHSFTDHRDLLALPDLDAVAICTPPGPRHAIARDTLQAGKHALLEKPPTATLGELADLERLAAETRRSVFTTWHAQYNSAVDAAREALAGTTVRRLKIAWKEDVRHWHPGQQWIWEAGGFGVFDPGINALSIVTRIMPTPLFLRRAVLEFPSNRDAPIAAHLDFGSDVSDAQLTAEFDWRQTGPQSWDIEVETDPAAGGEGRHLLLADGGARLVIDGATVQVPEPGSHGEYAAIYRRFAELLDTGHSEIDPAPFRLVADAFMLGRRIETDPFVD